MVCKIGDIVTDVITELSQVPGVATQIYAAPRIRQYVQDAILLELGDGWYPDYMHYFMCVPDGVSGLLTQDMVGPISTIDNFSDIAYVWPSNSNQPLKQLPPRSNPTRLTGTGSFTTGHRMFISPDYTFPNRPFRVWPANATDTLTVWAQQHPTLPVQDTDNVYVDRLLLTYDAAWMYVTDDGTVPAQVDKFEKLAIKRRSQVKSNFLNQPLPLDSRYAADDVFSETTSTPFVLDTDPLA